MNPKEQISLPSSLSPRTFLRPIFYIGVFFVAGFFFFGLNINSAQAAISLKTAGTWARIVADPSSVTIPGTPAAGDRMFLFVSWKDYAITVAQPTGWTLIGTEFADGAVTAGNAVGSVKVMAWYRDWQSGDGNPSVNWSAAPTEGHGVVMLWTKGGGDTWDTPLTVTGGMANWTTSSQVFSASSTVAVPSGGVVMGLVGIRDDSTTMTRPTTGIDDSAAAITWNGNYVESPATHFNSTTGLDMSGDLGHRLVTTGGTVTLRMTGTITAAETGAGKWVVQGLAPPAGACSSAGTGAWATGGTWGAGCLGAGGIPAATDAVTILNTHNVTIATGVSGVAAAVTINNGGTLTITSTGTLTASGNYINNGTNAGTGALLLTGSGTTIGGTTGTNTLSGLTTFTNNKTISAGAVLALSGALTISSGTTTNNGAITVTGLLTLTGNWTQGASSTLNYGSATIFAGAGTFTATASPNTVNYTAAAPNCKVVAYYHLTFSGSGAVTCLTLATVGGNLIFSTAGAMTWTTGADLAITGTFTIGAGVTVTGGTGNVTVTGGDVTGDGTINMTGGTFLVDTAGNFGGATGWTFANLTFGDGSGVTTTTATGAGAITVTGTQTVKANQTLNAGSKTWNLTGAPTSSSIAWVQDASNGNTPATLIAATPASNVTAGNLIVVNVLFEIGRTPAITDGQGNTYTLHKSQNGDRTHQVYSTIATATGSLTVTNTVSGVAGRVGITVTEFSGSWDASRVDGTPASATATGTAVSSGNTTSTGDALFFGATTSSGATMTPVLGTGYSNLEHNVTGRIASESKVVVGGATDDADFTIDTAVWTGIVVAFKSAAGGVIAWVQDTSADTTSGASVATPSINVTAGNLIVVNAMVEDTASSHTVTDSQGNTYTLDKAGSTYIDKKIRVYSTLAASTAALVVTLTQVGGTARLGLTVTEFSGSFDASRVDGTPAQAVGTGTAVSSGNTTSAGDALFYGAGGGTGINTWSLGSGYTNLEENTNGRVRSESKVISGGSTDDADFTMSTSVAWGAIVVAYKESAAGGVASPLVVETNGVFTAGSSTVKFQGNGDITIPALTYNNLTFSPTVATASKTYTFASGTTTVGGNLDINPSAGSALSLTAKLGGTLNVTGSVTIQKTSSATAVLDTNAGNHTLTAGSITISSGGTLGGTGNVTVTGGDVTGDGTITMTGGTFLVDTAGNFGGATAWTFNNLTFGDGTGATTTTATGAGAITVSGAMTVKANQTLNAGSKIWNLTGVGAGGGAAMAFVQTWAAEATAITPDNPVGTGNLIAMWIKWEGATTGGATVSDGTSSLQMGTLVNHANTDLHGQFAYLLSSNSGSRTYTVTFPSGAAFQRLRIFEFSYSGAISLDAQNVGSGTSTTAASGTITTTGTDEVVFGGYGEYSGATLTNPLINGVAAGGVSNPLTDASTIMWYRLPGATFSNGTAQITLGASQDFLTNVIAFKNTSSAGTPLVVETTGVFTKDTSTFNFKGISALNVPALAYHNVAFIPASGSPTYTLGTGSSQTISASGTFTVGDATNAVTVTAATNNPTINVTGDFWVKASAAFTSTSGTLTLGGNFTNTPATTIGFAHNSGTVKFNTTTTATITGTTTFYTVNVSGIGAAKTIQFVAGTTFSFAGPANSVTVTGTAGNLITITSTTTAVWLADFANTQNTLTYVFLQHSGCSTSAVVTMDATSTNDATATINDSACWVFPATGGMPIYGDLTSAVFDSTAFGSGVAYNSIMWKGTLGGVGLNEGKVRFQLATASASTGPWNYYGGATCGSLDFFDTSGSNNPIELKGSACLTAWNNKRYFRYKIRICSNDCVSAGTNTPTVDDVIVNWSP